MIKGHVWRPLNVQKNSRNYTPVIEDRLCGYWGCLKPRKDHEDRGVLRSEKNE
jgi:hypothetical protein